jgi:hypothetical protein
MAVRFAMRQVIFIAVVGCFPVGAGTTGNRTSITLMFGVKLVFCGSAHRMKTRMMIR